MPVNREQYEKLVRREMARYRATGKYGGDQDARDQAVRAANVAAGYGQSTALKYPVGRGKQSVSRESGKTKQKKIAGAPTRAGDTPKTVPIPPSRPGEEPTSGKNGAMSTGVGRFSDEYVKPVAVPLPHPGQTMGAWPLPHPGQDRNAVPLPHPGQVAMPLPHPGQNRFVPMPDRGPPRWPATTTPVSGPVSAALEPDRLRTVQPTSNLFEILRGLFGG